VGRGRLLLVESNGLSIFRKMRELTPGHRRAGERSYTPWQYRGFFEGHRDYVLESFELAPFLFPFKCPQQFLPLLVRFNAIAERIPVLRWQCSSVWMRVRYRRAPPLLGADTDAVLNEIGLDADAIAALRRAGAI